MSIKKAIFPIAGLGTRFLPVTKTIPKEMLPIIDKPLIQYAVEEAIDAGIEQLIFITSPNKVEIEDYFDSNRDLEHELEKHEKFNLLPLIKDILPTDICCVYIRQRHLLGLGHAILCAKELIGNDSFAVILPDDLMHDKNGSCLKQMIAHYQPENPASMIAVKPVPQDTIHLYGIVSLHDNHKEESQIKDMVEKPKESKSNLAILGRYILTPKIFKMLEKIKPGKNGELQLTDALSALLQYEKVFAHHFSGNHYDCGSKIGFLQANVAHALARSEIEKEFKAFLQKIIQ